MRMIELTEQNTGIQHQRVTLFHQTKKTPPQKRSGAKQFQTNRKRLTPPETASKNEHRFPKTNEDH
jgi:hypothetical protein